MGNGFAQLERLHLGTAYASFVINFADAGGAYPGDAKNVYEDAARTLPVTTVTADNLGMARWYADGVYKMFIEDSLGNPLWTDDNVQMTSDMGTEFEENLGLAAPAAELANLGQMFLKLDADNVFSDLEINTGDDPGFSFKSLIATYLANQPLTDIKLKLPIADVRAYGAVCDGVTDDSAAVNSAVTALSSGGTLLYPPACTTRQLNVALDDDIEVVGLGGSAVKLTDAATGADNLFSGANKRNINFYNITLDGNNKGGATNVLRFTKTSGSFMYVKLHNIKVVNHEGWAVYATGTAGTDFNPITIIDCSFEELERAIHMRYCKPVLLGNQLNNINKTAGSKGIYLGDCTGSLLGFNRVSGYGASGIGIQLDSCSDSLCGFNDVRGTEAYGIIANGSSDWNVFLGNNVRGGHATTALSFAGTNTKAWFNLGTTNQQDVVPISAGGLSIGSFLFIKKEGETTSTETGIIKDTGEHLYDLILPERDLVWFEDYPFRLFFMHHEPTDDNEIDVYNSAKVIANVFTPVFDNTTESFPITKNYKVYPNIRDDETDVAGAVWELHGEDTLVAGIGATDQATFTIFAEVEPIRVDIYQAGSASVNIASVTYDYAGETGIQVLATENTSGSALLGSFWLFRKTGINQLVIDMTSSAAGVGDREINIKVYHRKRDVDLTGSLA